MIRRILFFTLFLLFQTTILSAQNALAKIEYSYAEEAYSNNDYKKALEHLEEVKSLLGSTNARVMYLEINCLQHTFSIKRSTFDDYKLYKEINELTNTYISNFENDAPFEKLKAVYEIQKEYKPYAIEIDNLIKGKNYQDEKNFDEAIQVYTIACEAENPEACKNLANVYNIKEDFDNAKKINDKAITLGSINAKHNKGYSLCVGLWGYSQDITQGLQILEETYNSGLWYASYTLGLVYLNVDILSAKIWFTTAYSHEYKNSAIYLYLYFPDLRTEQLYRDAYKATNDLLKREPKNGLYNYYKAFLLSSKGRSPEALKYYEIACNNGNAWSCKALGNDYLNGTMVTKDKKKGKELLSKACALDPQYCN